MVNAAFRPLGHLTAWLVWHATRVSLLDDVDGPALPAIDGVISASGE